MFLHFNIYGILRSKSLNLKPSKILEAPDPATQFEIPEDGDPRLHLYENLKHSLITGYNEPINAPLYNKTLI
jgi:hypothetical protein